MFEITADPSDLFGIDEEGNITFDSLAVYDDSPEGENTHSVQVTTTTTNGELTVAGTQTIAVTVLAKPEISSDSTVIVPENQTEVMSVVATDAEDDAAELALTYELTGEENDADLFTISPNGELSFLDAPNFEAPFPDGEDAGDNTYEVDVTVTDSDGLSDTLSISVFVGPANDAPVITSNGGVSPAEFGVVDGQTLATTITAFDEDGSETFGFGIVISPDENSFQINDAGELEFTDAPSLDQPGDFDGDNIYEVTVIALDDDGAFSTQDLRITVSTAPEIDSDGGEATATVEVTEQTTDVTTVTATDVQDAVLSYSISGGADQDLFEIDAETGALSFIDAPDFENPVNESNSYEVEVSVTDSDQLSDSQTLTVNVTDQLDPPELDGDEEVELSVAENQTEVIFTATATDLEDDATDPPMPLTFEIADVLDGDAFSIDAGTGELTFQVAPSYESPTDAGGDNVYEVEVLVRDSDDLTDTQRLSVTILDDPIIAGGDSVDVEAAEPFDEPFDLTHQLVVGDSGFSEGNWPEVEGPENAINQEGQKYLNFEHENSGFFVQPQGENAEDIATSITFWTANDHPGRDPASFRLFGSNSSDLLAPSEYSSSDEVPFDLFTEIAFGGLDLPDTRNAGGTAELIDSNSQTIGFENSNSYDSYLVLFPTVKDESLGIMQIGEVQLNYDGESLASGVFDVDDEIAGLSLIEVEPPAVPPVATFEASDTEDGELDSFTITGGADASLFQLDGSDLRFISTPDFEDQADADDNNVFEVEVSTVDSDGQLDTQTINVTLLDAPVVTSHEGESLAMVSIEENQTTVTTVSATDTEDDADEDEETFVTYEVVDFIDDGELFEIDEEGVLSFASSPDFEDPMGDGLDNTYNVTVIARDSDGLVATQGFEIEVTAVNEAPIIESGDGANEISVTIGEGHEGMVTEVEASDPEDGELLYLLSGADSDAFDIDDDGVLSTSEPPSYDPEGDNVLEVNVIVLDVSSGLTDSQLINVSITAAPEIDGGETAAYDVDENSTEVGTISATDVEDDADAEAEISFSISGGDDAGLFTIDASTGALSFMHAPDFEQPTDIGGDDGDNVYELTVRAKDSSELIDEQAITVSGFQSTTLPSWRTVNRRLFLWLKKAKPRREALPLPTSRTTHRPMTVLYSCLVESTKLPSRLTLLRDTSVSMMFQTLKNLPMKMVTTTMNWKSPLEIRMEQLTRLA